MFLLNQKLLVSLWRRRRILSLDWVNYLAGKIQILFYLHKTQAAWYLYSHQKWWGPLNNNFKVQNYLIILFIIYIFTFLLHSQCSVSVSWIIKWCLWDFLLASISLDSIFQLRKPNYFVIFHQMLLKKSTLQEFHVSILRIQKFVLNNHWILNARDTAVEVENNKLEKR